MADILRDVKIKQLPVMDTLDRDAIMLIEDDQDTKQIKVDTLVGYMDSLLNSKINNMMIQEKIQKMDDAIDRLEKLADSMEKAEAARVEEFNTMRKEHAEFLAKYQSIKDTWDKTIVPKYEADVVNESNRQSNEQYRITEFANWTSAQNTMQNQENTRQTNESNRKSAEDKRISSENTRISSENTRTNAESNRQGNESTRQTNESNRKSAEDKRISSENTRISSENTRVSAETKREENEVYRVNNEKIRVSNEDTRIANEEKRENLVK